MASSKRPVKQLIVYSLNNGTIISKNTTELTHLSAKYWAKKGDSMNENGETASYSTRKSNQIRNLIGWLYEEPIVSSIYRTFSSCDRTRTCSRTRKSNCVCRSVHAQTGAFESVLLASNSYVFICLIFNLASNDRMKWY